MKYEKYFLYALILLFLISCNKEKKEISFSNETNSLGEILEIKDLTLTGFNGMLQLDSFLILTNFADVELRITIINLNTGKFVKRGRSGRGPFEFGHPINLNRSTRSGSFDIFDSMHGSLFTYNADSCFNNKLYTPVKNTFDGIFSCMDIVRLHDNKYFATGLFKSGRYMISDAGKKSYFYDYPDDGKNFSNEVKSMAYQGTTRYNYKKKKFISVRYFGVIIDLLKLEDNKLIRLNNIENPLFEYSNASGNSDGFSAAINIDEKRTFLDLDFNDEMIFYLYSGKSMRLHKSSSLQASEIWISDWSLASWTKIYLDKEILKFTIDEEGNNLYAIGHIENDLKILRFKLPQN